MPPQAAFSPWCTKEGVTVSIARRADQLPWIRGEGLIHTSAEKVFLLLSRFEEYGQLFHPAMKSATVLDRASNSARLHILWTYPFPLRDRDAIVRYQARREGNGAFLIWWESDARPGDPHTGVRIEQVAGQTEVLPLDSLHCRLIYTCLGDLGGHFGKRIEEKAWRAEPIGYFEYLRHRWELQPGAKFP